MSARRRVTPEGSAMSREVALARSWTARSTSTSGDRASAAAAALTRSTNPPAPSAAPRWCNSPRPRRSPASIHEYDSRKEHENLAHPCYDRRMTEVASRELRNNTRALLDRVAGGEEITITVGGRA